MSSDHRAFRRSATGVLMLMLALGSFGCLTAKHEQQSFYVLHGAPAPSTDTRQPPIPGVVRVRNLDPASAYDKFQIVVRKSPFELRYSTKHVWAVKPHRMLSDIIAQALTNAGTFSAVTRELGSARPRYSLDGDLEAIEIYDSGDTWYGHLAVHLRLSEFSTGEVVASTTYDNRKIVESKTYSHAARTISELMNEAVGQTIAAIDRAMNRSDPKPGRGPEDPTGPLLVPERPAVPPTTGDRVKP